MSQAIQSRPRLRTLIARLPSGSSLAVATALSGLLSYAFNVILTRSLGPDQYGSVGTLLGIAVVATVPATALQLETARLVASGTAPSTSRLVRDSAVVSAATTLIALAASPVLDDVLRLSSAWDAISLALLLFPQTLTGGLLGILLGRHRLGFYSLALVGVGVGRLAAGLVTSAIDGNSTFALGAAAVGSGIAAVGASFAVLATADASRPAPIEGSWPRAKRLARAAGGAASLMVLLNVDLVAARVLLLDAASGQYAFLTLFGRITFWGTSFLSLWIYPRIAASGHQVKAIRAAVGLVAAGSACAVFISLVAGEAIVHLVAGDAYTTASGYAPAFAMEGALLSLIQLAIYIEVAQSRHHLSLAVWAGCAFMVLLYFVVPIHSIGGVIRVALGVMAGLAALSLWAMAHPPAKPSITTDQQGPAVPPIA